MKELIETSVEIKLSGLKHGDRIYLQQQTENLFKPEEVAYKSTKTTNTGFSGPTKIHRLPPAQQGG